VWPNYPKLADPPNRVTLQRHALYSKTPEKHERVRNRPANCTTRSARELAVYDGREFVGAITEQNNGQFAARTADGRKLGHFNSWRAAGDAVWTDHAARRSVAPHQ